MSTEPAAWEAFAAAYPELADAEARAARARVEQMDREAREAWPQLRLPAAAFARRIAACIDPDAPALPQLQRLPAADLFLACACATGDGRAIAAFEQTHSRQIAAAIGRMKNRHLLPEDFKQILRRKLFVGEGDQPPTIERYLGQGALGAWVRVTALRTALNLTRGQRPIERGIETDEDLFDFTDDASLDPEVQHLKTLYRDAFRRAFLDTLDALPPRDKTLLRQSVLHGLTVRQIASLHDVHHATAARWLAQVRARLLEGTHGILRERLAVSPAELESIMGMIASRLDVSVVRALDSRPRD